jgi:hypothetical protein
MIVLSVNVYKLPWMQTCPPMRCQREMREPNIKSLDGCGKFMSTALSLHEATVSRRVRICSEGKRSGSMIVFAAR